jgi:hypothetical protein
LTAVATVGVAALPLDGSGGDNAHAAAAFAAYATLAALPFFASRSAERTAPARSVVPSPISPANTPIIGPAAYEIGGMPLSAALSRLTAVAIAGALAASAVLPHHVGLAQRIGLTLGDAWIVASAVSVLRHKR